MLIIRRMRCGEQQTIHEREMKKELCKFWGTRPQRNSHRIFYLDTVYLQT